MNSSVNVPGLAAPLPGARRGNSRKRGYILIATSLALMFLLGVAGLAIDIGRMYIAKNEAQSYVDSAAIAAAMQLDGSTDGITRATNAARNGVGRWELATTPFTNITTKFATDPTGPFIGTPPVPPTDYNYVQVVTTVNVPMYLMSALVGPASQVGAGAVAGRSALSHLPGGVFPFSPYTRKGYPGAEPDKEDDPYGYKVKNQYTLRWGAPGDVTDCGSDKDHASLAMNGKVRGYCCVSQSAASLREAIVGADTDPVTVGDPVPMDNGAKNTEPSAVGLRSAIDTDNTSNTYAEYLANGKGNGARVVVVVVNGGDPNYIAQGFAGFFLLPQSSYEGLNGNQSACAEYIGAWTEGLPGSTPGATGAWRIRLFR